ncbi:MAG: biosynthetic-type acetolactate synthase large subunit [Clostridiales bacterium]|nr:biosynthetic-type acetolactate synthase large subunit [Clostridiales bacterium]
MLSGAEIILKQLIERKIDTVFGYPGGAIMPVYDELLKYDGVITHYRSAHEQGAMHAADGYFRSTGNVGICFVTSGPGATNTITGLATAYMDSIPVVVFAGQVPTTLLGKDSFQEIDITSICEPITKKTFLVEDVDTLASIVDEAISIALDGRQGPVLVDLPKDVLLAMSSNYPYKAKESKKDSFVDEDMLTKVAQKINSAKRPLIYAGGGAKTGNASKSLFNIATKASIPVANTLMGLGTFPRDNPLSLGLSGMHGHPETNEAINNCDLLITVGARFSDRSIGTSSTFAKKAFIIHFDIDDTEFSKNIESHLYVKAPLDNFLKELLEKVNKNDNAKWNEWINSRKHPVTLDEVYCPENILKLINSYYDENTILVTDTGQHQLWAAQFWKFKNPDEFLTSGGLGTMGYGLGAAIGAAIGNPDKNVVLITGDGSFRMNCNEMLTVSKYNLPLTIILMNNESLGMVRQWQKLFNDKRYSETTNQSTLDYLRLSNAYGINSKMADSLDSLKIALDERKSQSGPFFIEVKVDKNDDVYPIVPPGKSIAEYIVG